MIIIQPILWDQRTSSSSWMMGSVPFFIFILRKDSLYSVHTHALTLTCLHTHLFFLFLSPKTVLNCWVMRIFNFHHHFHHHYFYLIIITSSSPPSSKQKKVVKKRRQRWKREMNEWKKAFFSFSLYMKVPSPLFSRVHTGSCTHIIHCPFTIVSVIIITNTTHTPAEHRFFCLSVTLFYFFFKETHHKSKRKKRCRNFFSLLFVLSSSDPCVQSKVTMVWWWRWHYYSAYTYKRF